jgi:hypothetical protein
MKKAQKKEYARIAALGCALCRHLGLGETPSHLHHIRRLGMKRDNAPVIPLCPTHHVGNEGVHGLGKKAFAERYGVTEEDLLEQTKDLLCV